ncbi:phosphatase PAP2 family protein [Pseudoroseomonas cervicalis]|uniref:phosphatase PAP2 family protein n=1 Tax=Teichococcus cervicalis TaxID=204525 RepID=UPI0022F1D6EA|nr:phosphatase PAP2 family protein [Pseudoroseomonas cervicalis]WBV43395.1 phosphatase PAP2 family protein [Pseudoroseomonas cervicalis]
MDWRGRLRRFSWGQFVMLAALLLCAGALLGFAALVDEALEGDTHAFDRTVLLALRDPADTANPIGPFWLEIMMRDFTSLGSHAVLMLIGALALGYMLLLRKPLSALLLALSFGGATALNGLLKQGFDRPRPELVSHLVEVHTASFPSGHAMLSAACYLTLGTLLAGVTPRRRLKLYVMGAAMLLTLLVGGSRVYLGVHWPTDVLAGWCLGAAWAMGCWVALRLWLSRQARRAGAAEPPPHAG